MDTYSFSVYTGSRFIVNVPDEELESIQRVCFQMEQAHWFYEDFVREENPLLPSVSLKHFSLMLFRHCPLLQHWADDHDHAFARFMEYKTRVPVCGAIILNHNLTKILLVRGWKSSSSWGFPKGKINKDEPEIACAVREVYEEIGFDTSPYIRQNEYVERTMTEQRIRLYIIAGIPESTQFATKTRKEIGDIRWFDLELLPGYNVSDPESENRASETPKKNGNVKKAKFFLVTSFASALRRWVRRFKKAKRIGKERSRAHLKVVQGYDSQSDSENEGMSASDVGSRRQTQNSRKHIGTGSHLSTPAIPSSSNGGAFLNNTEFNNNSMPFQSAPVNGGDYSSQYVISHSDVTFMETALKKMMGMGLSTTISPVPAESYTLLNSPMPAYESDSNAVYYHNIRQDGYHPASHISPYDQQQQAESLKNYDSHMINYEHPSSMPPPPHHMPDYPIHQNSYVPDKAYAYQTPQESTHTGSAHMGHAQHMQKADDMVSEHTLSNFTQDTGFNQNIYPDTSDPNDSRRLLLQILQTPMSGPQKPRELYKEPVDPSANGNHSEAILVAPTSSSPLTFKKTRQPSLATDSPEPSLLPNPSPRMLQHQDGSKKIHSKKSKATPTKNGKHYSNNSGKVVTDDSTLSSEASHTINAATTTQDMGSASLLRILQGVPEPAPISDIRHNKQQHLEAGDHHAPSNSHFQKLGNTTTDKSILMDALLKGPSGAPLQHDAFESSGPRDNSSDLLSLLLGKPSASLTTPTVPSFEKRNSINSPRVAQDYSLTAQKPLSASISNTATPIVTQESNSGADLLAVLLGTASISAHEKSTPFPSTLVPASSIMDAAPAKVADPKNAKSQEKSDLLSLLIGSEPAPHQSSSKAHHYPYESRTDRNQFDSAQSANGHASDLSRQQSTLHERASNNLIDCLGSYPQTYSNPTFSNEKNDLISFLRMPNLPTTISHAHTFGLSNQHEAGSTLLSDDRLMRHSMEASHAGPSKALQAPLDPTTRVHSEFTDHVLSHTAPPHSVQDDRNVFPFNMQTPSAEMASNLSFQHLHARDSSLQVDDRVIAHLPNQPRPSSRQSLSSFQIGDAARQTSLMDALMGIPGPPSANAAFQASQIAQSLSSMSQSGVGTSTLNMNGSFRQPLRADHRNINPAFVDSAAPTPMISNSHELHHHMMHSQAPQQTGNGYDHRMNMHNMSLSREDPISLRKNADIDPSADPRAALLIQLLKGNANAL
ncbi:hypothetical protein BSLG_000199 [Batrachochytrium salamandrivorans]|nr:hypothetical protein BSLG_000199 [Batrachochytrium salamandrivorans]